MSHFLRFEAKRAPTCVQCQSQWLPKNFPPYLLQTSPRNTSMDEVSTVGFAVIPHIRSVTEPTKRSLADHNIKVEQ